MERRAAGFLSLWPVGSSGAPARDFLRFSSLPPMGLRARLSLLISIHLLGTRLQERVSSLVGSVSLRTPPSLLTSCYWILFPPASSFPGGQADSRNMTVFWTLALGSPGLASLFRYLTRTYQLGWRVQLDVFQGSSELELQCTSCVCLHRGCQFTLGNWAGILSLPFAL